MAMNGWGEAEPAWWLNLQAHPNATVKTRDGVRPVLRHPADGAERERLWSRWAAIDKNLDAYAARRPGETAVVVLEPRPDGAAVVRFINLFRPLPPDRGANVRARSVRPERSACRTRPAICRG